MLVAASPLRWLASVALAAVLLIPHPVRGFHQGGVGFCEGCHGLHGVGRNDSGASFLLTGSDASSTCLGCHADHGAEYAVLSADGSRYTPGGDFYWLGKTFSWTEGGVRNASPAERHGHNVVAADFGLSADGSRRVAPGGTFPAAGLSCTSCHNPHGQSTPDASAKGPVAGSGSYGARAAPGTRVGDFRLLWGAGEGPSTFQYASPVARAPEDWAETDRNHVAYGSGTSEWCGNCHAGLVGESSGIGGGKHPAGLSARLGAAAAANYNRYVKTGDLSGSRADSYLALVPVEQGTTDLSVLDPASTQGPDEGANVMCLTCHRAHASAFEQAGRWDFSATVLADSHPRTGDGGATGDDARHSYYGRDVIARFGPYQRSLCAKCHPVD
ncbi:MAG: cytochrome C [Deltaproteobacteria bacterium]|nr:cytochrome C [Deltaproteobacteria bacterium]